MRERIDTIYCIGDSHVSFFSGEDKIQPCYPERSNHLLSYFRVFRLGPVLAYNLSSYRTTTKGREQLFEVLKHRVPSKGWFQQGRKVLLCFGEIDCRAHLLRQAELQRRNITSVVEECIDRYARVILEIRQRGYRVLIWNVIPSSRLETSSIDFPTYGTCKERNYVTQLFNTGLARMCSAWAIQFISIFDDLVDEQGLTRTEYYFDDFHLSQLAMPLTLQKMKALEVIGN